MHKYFFKIILTITILLILAFFTIFFLKNTQTIKEINFYIDKIYISNESKPFSYSGGTLFNGVNKVENYKYNNEASRIVNFYIMNLVDPIYLIKYQDGQIKDLEKTFDNLILINDKFKKYYSIDNDIFPIKFFYEYTNTLKEQNNFFSKISLKSALKYLESQEKLNDAYINDAIRIKENMIKATKEAGINKQTRIYQLDNYTTSSLVEEDFNKIIKNGTLTKVKLLNRRKCLTESVNYCENYISDSFANDKKGVNNSELNNAESVIDTGAIFNIKSGCLANKSSIVYVKKDCPEFLNYCYNYTDLLNEKKFEPIGEKYPFDILLKEKGVKVIPKNITTPYTCYDYSYQALISNYSYFNNEIINNPEENLSYLLNKEYLLGIKKNIEEIISIENKIKSSSIYNQDDYELLMTKYSILQNIFLKEIKINKQNISDFNLINNRYLKLKGNLMDMSLFLNKIVFHDSNNIISNKLSEQKNITGPALKSKDLYLYFSRNNYSVFFLSFSPFVWINNEKLKYFETDNKTKVTKDRILDYTDAKEKYTEKNLIEWTDIFKNSNKGLFYSKYYKEYGFENLLNK